MNKFHSRSRTKTKENPEKFNINGIDENPNLKWQLEKVKKCREKVKEIKINSKENPEEIDY